MPVRSFPVLVAAGLGLALAGCASSAANIEAAYVSPMNYESYTCAQLEQEAERVSQRAVEVTGRQNERATRDAVATGVGLVLFWPALFFVRGDGAQAAEVARLKGEMETIEKVSIRKNCAISFQRE
ncbi:MAG: hypothetical protein ACXIVE_10835 [Salinarimonas sp.]